MKIIHSLHIFSIDFMAPSAYNEDNITASYAVLLRDLLERSIPQLPKSPYHSCGFSSYR